MPYDIVGFVARRIAGDFERQMRAARADARAGRWAHEALNRDFASQMSAVYGILVGVFLLLAAPVVLLARVVGEPLRFLLLAVAATFAAGPLGAMLVMYFSARRTRQTRRLWRDLPRQRATSRGYSRIAWLVAGLAGIAVAAVSLPR